MKATKKSKHGAPTADPITYHSTGFGVEPCPGCGTVPAPGDHLAVRPGEWRSYHVTCLERQMALEDIL